MKSVNKSTDLLRLDDSKVHIKTIDMHTGGEPLRVILEGFPEIIGSTILEKRQYVKTHYDHLRKLLMFEPRGHADMYGCLIVEPNDQEADFGIIFMHNEGYSTMCGHAIIAISKLAVKLQWVESVAGRPTKVVIDAPCGRINAQVQTDGRVAFEGVPSFILAKNQILNLQDFGTIRYDICYGGAFYAYVEIDQLDIDLNPEEYQNIIRLGTLIKHEVLRQFGEVHHPIESDLGFLYGTIFYQSPKGSKKTSRNVCVFADGEVDRSPTGSGVCGRMAMHYYKNEMGLQDEMFIESITGSVFKGSIKETCTYGPYDALIPVVEGTAFITGRHEFYLDPADGVQEGFLLR